MKKIAFVFDQVMHYHKELFQRLEKILPDYGYELVLLSGRDKFAGGRVALKEKIVQHQIEFEVTQVAVSSFKLRHQHGLAAQIAALRPAVVVTMCHSGTLSEWLLLRLKKQLNFKLVAWQCGYEYNPGHIKRWVLDKFIPNFDHHLAYHTNSKQYALKHGAQIDQVTVMHNTINEAAINCLPKQEARRLIEQRHPVLIGKQIVLFVGAVLEEKRLEIVFEALDLLACPELFFVLVGDGPHLDAIKQKYAHRNDFIATGRIVDGVGPYFDAADVFVLPGTGGLAINEAMAHGLAVISGYADGSADDLVIDGKNGFLLKNVSAEEIADRLNKLFSDPVIAKEMGEAGREMICGPLSFESFIDRIVNVLTESHSSTNYGKDADSFFCSPKKDNPQSLGTC